LFVEVFRITTDGCWELQVYLTAENDLTVPSLELTIPMQEIYADTDLIKLK
jgi:hypothetical protein